MLDKSTKAILTLGGFILVGGGLYYLLSKRKENTSTLISVTKYGTDDDKDSFYIYLVKEPKNKLNKIFKEQKGDVGFEGYEGLLRNKLTDANKGDFAIIRDAGALNGKYKILSKLKLKNTTNTLASLQLQNDGKWDKKEKPKNSYEGKTRYWFRKAPTIIIKKKK